MRLKIINQKITKNKRSRKQDLFVVKELFPNDYILANLKNMSTEEQIKQIIEENVKPMLYMDGGNIEFVEYADRILKVRLQGACSGCPFSTHTLKEGIERIMKEKIPEIHKVIAI